MHSICHKTSPKLDCHEPISNSRILLCVYNMHAPVWRQPNFLIHTNTLRNCAGLQLAYRLILGGSCPNFATVSNQPTKANTNLMAFRGSIRHTYLFQRGTVSGGGNSLCQSLQGQYAWEATFTFSCPKHESVPPNLIPKLSITNAKLYQPPANFRYVVVLLTNINQPTPIPIPLHSTMCY